MLSKTVFTGAIRTRRGVTSVEVAMRAAISISRDRLGKEAPTMFVPTPGIG